jgi:UDP-glucose 4-epimerase
LSALVALDWSEVDPSERIAGVVYEHGDICDPALKDLFREHDIDTVVHLASIVRAPKGAPADLAHRVDVLGTKNVLEACEDSGAKRLIVTSSGAAYGYHPDNPKWLDENDPLRGNDEFEYSKNKRLVEAMARTCTARSRTSSRNPSCWASSVRNRPSCSFGTRIW